MLKLSALAAIGLTIAGFTWEGQVHPAAALSPCDVSSRGEAIQWGQSHPGQSYVLACKTMSAN